MRRFQLSRIDILNSPEETVPTKRTRRVDGALLVAILALVVSAVQLVVTIPLINQKLFAPHIVVSRVIPGLKSNKDSVIYFIENQGSTPAHSVEVGVITVMGDDMIVFPAGPSTVINPDERQVIFVNRTIVFERILPDEKFTLIVTNQGRTRSQDAAAATMMDKSGDRNFPRITFVRSAEGVGIVTKDPVPMH